MNNEKLLLVIAIIVIVSLGIAAIIKWVIPKESFGAPLNVLKCGNYVFYDYGLGTHLYQANWSRGTEYQPFLPIDTGLYTSSSSWAPRSLRHQPIPYSCQMVKK